MTRGLIILTGCCLLWSTSALRLDDDQPPRRASLTCNQDDRHRCVYRVTAPASNGGELEKLNHTISDCISTYDSLEKTFSDFNDTYDAEATELFDLTAEIDKIETNMNKFLGLYSELQTIFLDTLNASTKIANYFNSLQDKCLKDCVRDRTDPPPQMPTTVLPTVPDPCAKLNCSANVEYPAGCVSSGTNAYCTCGGNLDKYEECRYSSCISKANSASITVDSRGPLWSPNYIRNVITNVSYPNNSECYWKIVANNKKINITFHSDDAHSLNLDETTTILVSSVKNDGSATSFTLKRGTDKKRFDAIMGRLTDNALYLEIKLTSGTISAANTTYFFDWELTME